MTTAGFTPSLMRNWGTAWVVDAAAKERAIAATVEIRVIVFTFLLQILVWKVIYALVLTRKANLKATG
jgi:hypothetical protein